MLNRRDALTSIVGLPLFSQVKENNDRLSSDEVKAKAEMWDLFLQVVQKAADKVERVGQQVNIIAPRKILNTNRYYLQMDNETIESDNLEEIYIRGLIIRLKELS